MRALILILTALLIGGCSPQGPRNTGVYLLLDTSGTYNEELGVKDVCWLVPDGSEMTEDHWHDPNARCLGMLMDGRAQPTGIRRKGEDVTLLLIVNAHNDAVNFRLPEVAQGTAWNCLVDTNRPDLRGNDIHPFNSDFLVTGHSLLLMKLERNGN